MPPCPGYCWPCALPARLLSVRTTWSWCPPSPIRRVGGAARRKPCGALELQVFADRDRIARDLHEHVIGRLFGIGLTLHGTQQTGEVPGGGRADRRAHRAPQPGHHRDPHRSPSPSASASFPQSWPCMPRQCFGKRSATPFATRLRHRAHRDRHRRPLGRCHGRGTHRLPLIVAIRSSSTTVRWLWGCAAGGCEARSRTTTTRAAKVSFPGWLFLPECVRDFSGTSCPECVKLLSGP